MGYPRYLLARAHKFATRTSGTLTCAGNQTWAAIDTGLDITLDAQAGDTIEVGINAMWSLQTGATRMDVACMVSGSPNSFFGTATLPGSNAGIPGWGTTGGQGFEVSSTGVYQKQLAAGDIVDRKVTLRLYWRNNNATARDLLANTDYPLRFFARNIGPVDPN